MDESVDPRAEKLLNDFLAALTANPDNFDAAVKAALPTHSKKKRSPVQECIPNDLATVHEMR